ncbi:hypothetical protein MPSEU_001100500 [Mayamaea pseudoterrestris]|nr:hypothetical protein MPSEU_001100500 [Mayamaea pseudoterrestris]
MLEFPTSPTGNRNHKAMKRPYSTSPPQRQQPLLLQRELHPLVSTNSTSSLPCHFGATTAPTTGSSSYLEWFWNWPATRQIPHKRKPKKQTLRQILILFCVIAFVGICIVHVTFLRNHRDRHELGAKNVSVASSFGREQHEDSQEQLQRKLEDVPLVNFEQRRTDSKMTQFLMEPQDYSQYTVRINSWKRPEQLRIAIQHYRTCSGVAQVQVVWCTAQGDPPDWLVDMEAVSEKTDQLSVIVEQHDINSLNERFNVLHAPATRGILTVDDDVLRPCLAMDAGFYKWTKHPDRMVGYDARDIVLDGNGGKWNYGYMSTTQKSNQYSLTLTRFAFLHVDHLNSYMTDMPDAIRDKVQTHLNCEDIAMSLWVSSQNNAQVPLLADLWAINSLVKLHSNGAISAMGHHKSVRDDCVDEFASLLGLKDTLRPAVWVHKGPKSLFDCGVAVEEAAITTPVPPRLENLQQSILKWKRMDKVKVSFLLKRMVQDMIGPALNAGLVQGTDQWKKRFPKAES